MINRPTGVARVLIVISARALTALPAHVVHFDLAVKSMTLNKLSSELSFGIIDSTFSPGDHVLFVIRYSTLYIFNRFLKCFAI